MRRLHQQRHKHELQLLITTSLTSAELLTDVTVGSGAAVGNGVTAGLSSARKHTESSRLRYNRGQNLLINFIKHAYSTNMSVNKEPKRSATPPPPPPYNVAPS